MTPLTLVSGVHGIDDELGGGGPGPLLLELGLLLPLLVRVLELLGHEAARHLG